jgi:hypothetical protein
MKDIIQWVIDFFTEYANTPMYQRTIGQDAWFIILVGLIAVMAVGVGSLLTMLIYKLKRWIKK